MTTLIKTENLNKHYRNTLALNNVNLSINEGDIYGLIGKNGAGKSSLLRVLCGQSTQYSGRIELFGKNLKQGSEQWGDIGTLIEYPAFYPELTGRKNLEYYRIQKGIKEKNRIEKILNDLDLIKFADKKFKQYSLGNKQRLGIALALLNNPKILILDEPTNGLDPIGIKEIRRLLLDINKKSKTTILISSHILSELEHLVTKIGFIDNGKIIEEISVEDFRSTVKNSIIIKVLNFNKIFPILKDTFKNNEVTLLDNMDIKISGKHIDISSISQIILQADEKIQSIHERTDSLEEYFINLVGGMDNEKLS